MTADPATALAETMQSPSGLILVCAPTGMGKTTTVLRAFEQHHRAGGATDSIVLMGDIRDSGRALASVALAKSGLLVVAVLRIPSAAGGFGRLIDMGADAEDLARVGVCSFGLRLMPGVRGRICVYEKLVVSDGIRELIARNVGSEIIYRRAVAEGLRTMREQVLDYVAAGEATLDSADMFTPE
jgi:type II secretory ATPase GspE/PulE/Tfp pilus assembly ATPase PilB-like protein